MLQSHCAQKQDVPLSSTSDRLAVEGRGTAYLSMSLGVGEEIT